MRTRDGAKLVEILPDPVTLLVLDENAEVATVPIPRLTANSFTTADGTVLYYKDWGDGPAVVFSHGYPLSSDFWEDQMLFLSQQGFRAIAFDRRGFGRSSQPARGYDMNTFADDLAGLVKALDLSNITLVGHSWAAARSCATSPDTDSGASASSCWSAPCRR